ncbi:MAG: hypothetical protein OXH96_16640, partial [Spirochaetaceae bacterium]|nr:hypothetical protein [Spirochaetaceae bacterium]
AVQRSADEQRARDGDCLQGFSVLISMGSSWHHSPTPFRQAKLMLRSRGKMAESGSLRGSGTAKRHNHQLILFLLLADFGRQR